MPKRKNITITVVAVDADGIAESQSPAGAGNLTLDGALGTSLTYASKLGITSDGNDSTNTFTVTGTDAHGRTQTEDVTGPNATTVETTKYYKTITSIAIDNAAVGNITVGTVDEVVSPIYPMSAFGSIEDGLLATVTGTINYTLEVTGSDVQNATNDAAIEWHNHDTMASKTADDTANIDKAITGLRLRINSYSSGAAVSLNIVLNRPK